jgi:hypothetical protein
MPPYLSHITVVSEVRVANSFRGKGQSGTEGRTTSGGNSDTLNMEGDSLLRNVAVYETEEVIFIDATMRTC